MVKESVGTSSKLTRKRSVQNETVNCGPEKNHCGLRPVEEITIMS